MCMYVLVLYSCNFVVVTLYVCMCTRPGKNGYSDWSEYKLQIKSRLYRLLFAIHWILL